MAMAMAGQALIVCSFPLCDFVIAFSILPSIVPCSINGYMGVRGESIFYITLKVQVRVKWRGVLLNASLSLRLLAPEPLYQSNK
jgi:hypothetical protein